MEVYTTATESQITGSREVLNKQSTSPIRNTFLNSCNMVFMSWAHWCSIHSAWIEFGHVKVGCSVILLNLYVKKNKVIYKNEFGCRIEFRFKSEQRPSMGIVDKPNTPGLAIISSN